ncbi:MAG TPA: class I SAM-dependent methyltransferase [Rhizomicrobium sp.]|nr:class I SAM-dependent methyltransferase [Rhizomicrobium sp.]
MPAHETVSWEEAVRRLTADPDAAGLVHDCYYDAPLEKAAERFHASDEWRSVRKVIGTGPGMALDVGAGNGIVSYALARDGWTVSALEPDPSDLVGAGAIRRLAAHAGIPIAVLEGFGEQVGMPPASFDLVIVRQVVHHAHDLDGFCREMARLLKPGGRFFSFRDHVADDEAQKQQFFREHPLHHLYGGENAYSVARYRAALEGAGLAVEKSWGHFAAPFNFAPTSPRQVVRGVAGKVLPGPLADAAAALLGGPLYPPVGALLSRLYRHPGRHVAFLARKP